MSQPSPFKGFYQKSVDKRRAIVTDFAALNDDEVAALVDPLPMESADHLIENVIGRYTLPFGVAVNFLINGRESVIPMVVEEPSIVAACSFAAKLCRPEGFITDADPPIMIGQIQLLDVPDMAAAKAAIRAEEAALLAEANALHRTIVELGGGAQAIALRELPDTAVGPMLIVHLLLDTRDAMGANAINTTAEALAPRLEALSGGRANLRILSNLADRRRARARATWRSASLAKGEFSGDEVVQGILEAWAFADADPYRAATHNKGILNGIDAVAVATGNDWRGIEAGAHAYAAQTGRYRSLTTFSRSEAGDLVGEIELPMAVGVVGGTTRSHPTAQTALKILGVSQADQLAQIMAAVGLAQNFAAIRALATEGIQRGHMALHARQVAVAAGASGEAVARIAQQLVAEGQVRVERARELLETQSGTATHSR
ncbi:MAG: hydroxymethylglutaryl-CoA reductase, degradative [Anaerolineales bacterium]|nr:hydroxymethylglutaryl-CoA reductase, degradative [Anaerolineales bacterium]MCB9126436.1 hydroxymethylglutaryl-CoA reductase, degradative [Ardenticatenales bacterium]MCB9171595.1 hydroxymethylglutaryl-CoA reductase, degradative [Ardenticatenales bacterium]